MKKKYFIETIVPFAESYANISPTEIWDDFTPRRVVVGRVVLFSYMYWFPDAVLIWGKNGEVIDGYVNCGLDEYVWNGKHVREYFPEELEEDDEF